ncbi:hypothetical protein [Kosakonia oryziphila]|uniref:UPF0509 protein YciZ n=1 Tax=Kosakonia oryziphila TaxID=1005667 RepID=A0A1C4BFV3_9ENTR|nr:hypothetical protein [Kosakonia oryziphila]SCC05723.1 hypothetical protein GA0061070_1007120 [Kosakonia oryziphila]
MADIDLKLLAGRIDTVLDILVGGDTQSAIRNLEILKAELVDLDNNDKSSSSGAPKMPWEI